MRREWAGPHPSQGQPISGVRLPHSRQRWLIRLGVAAATLIIAAIVGVFVAVPYFGEAAIRDRVLPKLALRIGHQVKVDTVSVNLGSATLGNLTVVSTEGVVLARVPQIVVKFAVVPALIGRIELATVRVENPDAVIEIDEDGHTSWDQLRRWLASKRSAKDDIDHRSKSTTIQAAKELYVVGGSFEVRDRARRVTVVGDGINVGLSRGKLSVNTSSLEMFSATGPRASLVDVVLTARPRQFSDTVEVTIGGGELVLSERIRLTGLGGKIAPASEDGQLWIDLAGGWDGSSGQVWTAVGHFDPRSRQGNLKISADRFALDRLADVLIGTPLRDVNKTFLGGELNIIADGQTISVAGTITVEGLNVFHRLLASEQISGVNFSGEVNANYELSSKTMTLERAVFESGGVEYQLDAVVKPGTSSVLGELYARLQIPPVDCQTVLDSLPSALLPKLQGFQLSGTFETHVEVGVSWTALDDTVLNGDVGIRNCKVIRPAGGMSARKLRGQFRHRVIVGFDPTGKPRLRAMTVGPSNPNFVEYSGLSAHLVNAILTTEDSGFFRHHGFIGAEFRTALIKNLKAGYFRYGASSITMQLVKNVYFDREKTLSRKIQELFMAWYVETLIPKERLMEIYLNAIEYGPSLYGIGIASKRIFGKPAAELNPTESAFVATLLPAPGRRFRQYCRDQMSRWTEGKIERILGLMKKRGRLSDAEYEQAMSTPVLFRPDKVGCGR